MPVAPFSHAVEWDGWIQLTGQMPTDPNDDAAPLALEVPAVAERCSSLAFDGAGDLWALCGAGTTPSSYRATLLRFAPDEASGQSFDVTDLVRSVSADALYAALWLIDGEVRAVVPTDEPPAEFGDEPDWGNATAVTLVEAGEPQQVGEAATQVLPSLRTDAPYALGASAGWRFTHSGGGGAGADEITLAWLTFATAVSIEVPADDWGASGGGVSSSFVGSHVAATYSLSTPDRTLVYGIVADGEGTTSVLRLPTSASGMPDLPDRPSPLPATQLLVAPDGSTHLLLADASGLTSGVVLPASP